MQLSASSISSGICLINRESLPHHLSSECINRLYRCHMCNSDVAYKQQKEHELSEAHQVKVFLKLVVQFQSAAAASDKLAGELVQQNQSLKEQVAELTFKLQQMHSKSNLQEEKVGGALSRNSKKAASPTADTDMVDVENQVLRPASNKQRYRVLGMSAGDKMLSISFNCGVKIDVSDGVKIVKPSKVNVAYLKGIDQYFIAYEPLASMLYDMNLLNWENTFEPDKLMRTLNLLDVPDHSQLLTDPNDLDHAARFLSYEALLLMFTKCTSVRNVTRSNILKNRAELFIQAFKKRFQQFEPRSEQHADVTNVNQASNNKRKRIVFSFSPSSSGTVSSSSSSDSDTSSSSSYCNSSDEDSSQEDPSSDDDDDRLDADAASGEQAPGSHGSGKLKKSVSRSPSLDEEYSIDSKQVYNLQAGDKEGSTNFVYHWDNKLKKLRIDTIYVNRIQQTFYRYPGIAQVLLSMNLIREGNRKSGGYAFASSHILANSSHARRIRITPAMYQLHLSYEGVMNVLRNQLLIKRKQKDETACKRFEQFIKDWKVAFEGTHQQQKRENVALKSSTAKMNPSNLRIPPTASTAAAASTSRAAAPSTESPTVDNPSSAHTMTRLDSAASALLAISHEIPASSVSDVLMTDVQVNEDREHQPTAEALVSQATTEEVPPLLPIEDDRIPPLIPIDVDSRPISVTNTAKLLNGLVHLNGTKIESHAFDSASNQDADIFARIRVKGNTFWPLHMFRVNNKCYLPIHQFIDLIIRYELLEPIESTIVSTVVRSQLSHVLRICGLSQRVFPPKSWSRSELASPSDSSLLTAYQHGDSAVCASLEDLGPNTGLSKLMLKEVESMMVPKFQRFLSTFFALIEQVKTSLAPSIQPSPSKESDPEEVEMKDAAEVPVQNSNLIGDPTIVVITGSPPPQAKSTSRSNATMPLAVDTSALATSALIGLPSTPNECRAERPF